MEQNFMEVMQEVEQWSGFSAVRKGRGAGYEARLAKMNGLLCNEARLDPHRHAIAMQEALGTPDFPNLFGDIIDRRLIASYKDTPQVLRPLGRQSQNKDFKNASRFRLDGADAPLENVPENGVYPDGNIDDVEFNVKLLKFGRRIPISWEAIVNDDLGAFAENPARLGRGARRLEEWRIAENVLYDSSGPHASTFGTNVGNQASQATTVLNIGNLETAVEAHRAYSPAYNTSLPINVGPKFLVVGPALEFTGKAILNSTQLMQTDGGSSTVARIGINNVIASAGLTLVIDPWLPKIATTNGATTWLLVSDPNQEVALFESATLAGKNAPEIWIRDTRAQNVAGGSVSPMEGGFEDDAVVWRIRHCYEAVRRDVLGGWASIGSG